MATAYKKYMVFESVSTEGKYIPLLYTATDEINANAILPSDSTSYTFPSSGGIGEKEVYLLRDVVVFDISLNPTYVTSYATIWMNDQKTEHIIINAINTRETVKRQFEKMEYIIGEGTPIKFKQK